MSTESAETGTRAHAHTHTHTQPSSSCLPKLIAGLGVSETKIVHEQLPRTLKSKQAVNKSTPKKDNYFFQREFGTPLKTSALLSSFKAAKSSCILWTLECLFRSNVIICRAHKGIQGDDCRLHISNILVVDTPLTPERGVVLTDLQSPI